MRRLALLWLFVCFAPCLGAERWTGLNEPAFRFFAKGDVTAIAQAQDGFLWVGMQTGLARWDGYRFHDYLADPAQPDSLPDSQVTALLADRHGRLWIGTSAAGLARYDRENDRFIAYPVGGSGLSNANVTSLAEDGDGGLWIGTDAGLNHLTITTGRFARLADLHPGASLTSDEIRSLLRDHRGRLWIGTHHGLFLLDKDNDKLERVRLPNDADRSEIRSLAEDDHGALWIGTHGYGAFLIESSSSPADQVLVSVVDPALAHETVTSIALGNPEEIWLGTLNKGLFIVNRAAGRSLWVRRNLNRVGSLSDDRVNVLLRDRAGSIWIGGTEGMNRWNRQDALILSMSGESERTNGISFRSVRAIMAARDGLIWLGSLAGGIDVINPAEGRIAQFLADPTRPTLALPASAVDAMVECGPDKVYIGTSAGLYSVTHLKDKPRRVALNGRPPDSGITALVCDGSTLWLGGQTDGLWAVTGLDDATPLATLMTWGEMTDRRVMSILRGAADDLWVGTSNGVNRINLVTHQVQRIYPALADPMGLPGASIASMVMDRQGRLWLGIFGGGIAVLTGNENANPRFLRLSAANGLPSRDIDSLVMDDAGMIWAAADGALIVIDPGNFAIRQFENPDGSENQGYWVGASAKTDQGEILLGGNSLTIIRPDRLSQWDYEPPIVLTELRVGGRRIPADRFNGPDAPRSLNLDAKINGFTAEFAALDLTEPQRNHYQYRLEGFDPGWIETDFEHRLATYTNLDPGSYVFRVRGSNRNGLWSDHDFTLPIIVAPSPTQTVWFKTITVILGLCMVAAITEWRTRYLRRQQQELERRVAQRTLELQSAKDALEKLAQFDGLTRIPNRRRFDEVFVQESQRRRRDRTPLSLLVIDVDFFKAYNDAYGHLGGDAALIQIAAICQAHLRRPGDLAARYGGEEFAVILPDTDSAGAISLAQKISAAVRDARIAHGHSPVADIVTVSIGVATQLPDQDGDAKELFLAADAALYRAKSEGRNQVVAAD